MSKTIEEWKILIYNGIKYPYYQVSNQGRIRSVGHYEEYLRHGKPCRRYRNGRIIAIRHSKLEDYYFTSLRDPDKKIKTIYIHKAVYETFIGPVKDYVTHIDGNVQHNYMLNLKTITHSELQIKNMNKYPESKMRLATINKKNNYVPRIKLSQEKVRIIKNNQNKLSIKEIAQKANCSISSVYKYLKNTK